MVLLQTYYFFYELASQIPGFEPDESKRLKAKSRLLRKKIQSIDPHSDYDDDLKSTYTYSECSSKAECSSIFIDNKISNSIESNPFNKLKSWFHKIYERDDVTLGLFNGFHSSIFGEIKSMNKMNHSKGAHSSFQDLKDHDSEDTLCYPCSFGDDGHVWSRNQHATDLLMPHHHVMGHRVS